VIYSHNSNNTNTSNNEIPYEKAKYLIIADIKVDGIVNRSDVIGAIFGQTEGLLDDLDLREAQRSGRIGRIEVQLEHKNGKTYGKISIPSNLDQVETAIVAAAVEQVERVGPCHSEVRVIEIQDLRKKKKEMIIDRAVQLYYEMKNKITTQGATIREIVIEKVKDYEIIEYGPDRCPAGPEVETSGEIIIVEGRNDVLNLLKNGYKNAIAVKGTNVPKTIIRLSQEKTATAFVDGDRGGLAILKELLQVADIDYVAVAPRGWEVEQLSYKQILKALRSRLNVRHLMSVSGAHNREEAINFIIQKVIELMEKTLREELEEYKEKVSDRISPPQAAETSKKVEEIPSKPIPSQMPVKTAESNATKPLDSSISSPPTHVESETAQKLQTIQQKAIKVSPEDLSVPEGLIEYVKNVAGVDFNELIEKRQAIILDKSGNMMKTVAVRDLINELRSVKKARTLILGGIITQRLIDAAYESGITHIVGLDTRGVVRLPQDIIIITRHNTTKKS